MMRAMNEDSYLDQDPYVEGAASFLKKPIAEVTKEERQAFKAAFFEALSRYLWIDECREATKDSIGYVEKWKSRGMSFEEARKA